MKTEGGLIICVCFVICLFLVMLFVEGRDTKASDLKRYEIEMRIKTMMCPHCGKNIYDKEEQE